jgi:hypothetical protein
MQKSSCMETGRRVSEIHAMDEREESTNRQESADFLKTIIYVTPVMIGWGAVVIVIGLYGISDPTSDKSLQAMIVVLGTVLTIIGIYAWNVCNRKLDQLKNPPTSLWTS